MGEVDGIKHCEKQLPLCLCLESDVTMWVTGALDSFFRIMSKFRKKESSAPVTVLTLWCDIHSFQERSSWKSFRMAPPLFHSIWNNNIVSNLPQWDILFCKNEWKSGGAIRKVIPTIYSKLRVTRVCFFSFIIISQLRRPIELKFSQVCYLMHVEIHQVRRLVFDNYQ